MAEVQLRLFPESKPLLERFGAEFFRAVPKRSGIYVMADESGRVLYIGKARNLRQRLASYKYPSASHKVARLNWKVRSITWELCDDGVAAGLRENELLRLHKPIFNVLNIRSEHYPFIGLQRRGEDLFLRLTKSAEPLAGEQLFGAFKGLPLGRAAFGALLRLLWLLEHSSASLLDLPSVLLRPKPVESWTVRGGGFRWEPLLSEFLSGQSDTLMASWDGLKTMNCFERTFYTHDREILGEFFARGPQRNAHLRRVFHVADRCISQSELDDLLVLREHYANPIAQGAPVG
jgi:hypothetical protein